MPYNAFSMASNTSWPQVGNLSLLPCYKSWCCSWHQIHTCSLLRQHPDDLNFDLPDGYPAAGEMIFHFPTGVAVSGRGIKGAGTLKRQIHSPTHSSSHNSTEAHIFIYMPGGTIQITVVVCVEALPPPAPGISYTIFHHGRELVAGS